MSDRLERDDIPTSERSSDADSASGGDNGARPSQASPKDGGDRHHKAEDRKNKDGKNKDGKNKGTTFTRFAKWTASHAGKPAAFILAFSAVVVWGVSGPAFGFSDTWQLVINTSTTIITFLMVFLIQHTQNTDTQALQLKIDEVIFALKAADNAVLNLEEMDEEELESQRQRYLELAKRAERAAH
jgi:low affinity Fe/Cu permease